MKEIQRHSFGRLKDGREAALYVLVNDAGESVSITDYGCAVVSAKVRDANGDIDDVVLGFDDVSGYESPKNPKMGAVCGRSANRIAKGRFTLNGTEYTLAKNKGENHLHGGNVGFSDRLWGSYIDGENVVFTLKSPDGDEGYPGNLDVRVSYTFTDRGELVIDYRATTDADTVCNLTNHTYFNLNGHKGDGADQYLMMNARFFTEANPDCTPTGAILPVRGPFDFSSPRLIGEGVKSDDEQIKLFGGYDHNFVLTKTERGACELAAMLASTTTGRCMQVFTTCPGIQVFSANTVDVDGKEGAHYGKYCGVALETQHFPDAPNKPHFPTTILREGRTYGQLTVYQFGVIAPEE